MADKEVHMKTSAMILKIVCFLILWMCCYGQQHPACQIWKNMAQQLSTQRQRQMTCYSNDTNPCTSLRCSGTYKYTSWLLPDRDNIEVDYCFGMRLNHCDNPVSMDMYLNVPSKTISYVKKISHNTQLQIPGFSFSLKNLGTVDVFLYFYMVRNGSNVNLALTAKVRITSFGGLVMWPQGMQKQIVPMEQIPVPPCDTNKPAPTEAPIHMLGNCHPPTWAPPTMPPGVSTTTQNPYVTPAGRSLTYNHYCGHGYPVCGNSEVCDLKVKKCQCQFNYIFNKSLGRCVRNNHYKRPCQSSAECGQAEICRAKRCMCMTGYSFNDRNRICMLKKSVTYNQTCHDGRPFCGELESCNLAEKRCVCLPDFNFDPRLQTCVSHSKFHQPCSDISQCGKQEQCHKGLSICVCEKDFTFNRQRQMCLKEPTGGVTVAPSKVIVSPTGGNAQPQNQQPISAPPANNVAIIAGAVVGGVVLLVLVGLFAFFMVRRARSPYQNREMLLSDDSEPIM